MSVWSERGCATKRTFLSKQDAKRSNESLRSKERKYGRQQTHVYLCPKAWGGCGYYHLGHPGDHE